MKRKTGREGEAMTKRRTVDERSSAAANRMAKAQKARSPSKEWLIGYDWGAYDGWLAGYRAYLRDQRAARREGKAKRRGNVTSIPCPECLGSGEDDFGTCLRCHGHGYVQEQSADKPAEQPLDGER
jgi:hypothetical protein